MKMWSAVIRYSLLGLVAVVLGTAAVMSGSNVAMVPEVAVAAEEGDREIISATMLRSTDEMTAAERERFDRAIQARNEGALKIVRRNYWWGDQMPYGCAQPSIQALGSQYLIYLDDGVWQGYSGQVDFWDCWISAFNGDSPGDDLVPHALDSVYSYFPYYDAANGTILHTYSDFNLQWGLFRGEDLLGYCNGTPRDCGRGPYYVNESEFTCEESLMVVLWDERYPPSGADLLFGYEIFEDVVWDEYNSCGS